VLRDALETAGSHGGNGHTAKAKPRTMPSVVRHGGRLTFGGNTIETGTDAYRLAATRARAEQKAAAVAAG
jgi:hypothetical protein